MGWRCQEEFGRSERSEITRGVGFRKKKIARRHPHFCFQKEATFMQMGRKSQIIMHQAASEKQMEGHEVSRNMSPGK